MVLNQLGQQLVQHGYLRRTASWPGAAAFQRQYGGAWYLICIIRDTGRNLRDGEFYAIMEQEAQDLYRESGGAVIYPLGVVISDDVSKSREYCRGNFPCWYIDSVEGRLIIYEDQPGDFLNLRLILENSLLSGRGGRPEMDLGAYRRRRTGAFRFTPVNTLLILINVLCFVFLESQGDTTDGWFMYRHGAMLIQDMNNAGEWYRLLTSAFLHFGISHLFNNMLVLLYLGDNLERVLGWWRYLVLYLVSAIGSAAISCAWYWMHGELLVVSAGASGAIFGVVGGLLYIVVRNRGRLEDISGMQLVLLIVLTLYHGITSLAGGVNNSAHIGGLFVGVMMGMLLYRKDGRRRR